QLGAHPANFPEVEGEEVEEEGAVRLGRQREHFALVIRRKRLVDELQIRRLSAKTRPVVNDLGRDLLRRVIEQDHGANRGYHSMISRRGGRNDTNSCPRFTRGSPCISSIC